MKKNEDNWVNNGCGDDLLFPLMRNKHSLLCDLFPQVPVKNSE